MGFQSGIGFIGVSLGGGGGGGNTITMIQYQVDNGAGTPVSGATSFTLPTPILGTNLFIGNPFILNSASTASPQYSVATSGGYVTGFTLLGGLTFNVGEVYTCWIYD